MYKAIEIFDWKIDINNIKKIHSIYDLVSVLKIEDLSEIHDLDEYEVEFLFNEISKVTSCGVKW